MENITENFEGLYHPVAGLVFYKNSAGTATYAEHFDMDKNGMPINAHPLTEREARALARSLTVAEEENRAFLKPKGVLPSNVLHINPSERGSLIWYTKARNVEMFFTESLEIANGIAEVPAMIWYANKHSLAVFAIASNRRPTEGTALYYAPFFNVYEDGNVCMGTVDVNIKKSSSVEEFVHAWQDYFFNSYFSHLVDDYNPVNGNCVSLWKGVVNTGKPFPAEILKKNNKTLKDLLR